MRADPSLGSFTSQASPSACSVRMPYQFMSNSYHASPWRADCGCAWWLLCQPSPKLRYATHHRLRESSSVAKRLEPHMCVPEFTNLVECNKNTVLRNIAQNKTFQPPRASSSKPTTRIGNQ